MVDLVGKQGRVRTVPMPTWVKVAIDAWAGAAGISDGPVFRSVYRGGESVAHPLHLVVFSDGHSTLVLISGHGNVSLPVAQWRFLRS